MSENTPGRCPHDPRDPFEADREKTGIKTLFVEGQEMPLILRLQDLRRTCKDWKTFSNDDPFMIVPQSEADVRSVRQYPIETDPPDHTQYRSIVEPFFRKPMDPAYQAGIEQIVDRIVSEAVAGGPIEVVREFALPMQSRSLARLLGVPDTESDIYISWGTHVFKDGDGRNKGGILADYITRKFEEALGSDGDDLFSTLNRAKFDDRDLTLEERHGFANMAFAGGRDTVIQTVSSIVAHLAENPDDLAFLKEDQSRITPATEEFVRYVSPLTVIARRCPHGAEVSGYSVPERGRVGLCWPSANRDATAFDRPDEVVLDRSPNPHVGFGFGIHKCLGAPQARLIIRSLLQKLCTHVDRIHLLGAEPEIEVNSSYSRQAGYKTLKVNFE